MRDELESEILVVVGGAKVSGTIFELADYNIAIGHQPHSEVAALAVFLDNVLDDDIRNRPIIFKNVFIIEFRPPHNNFHRIVQSNVPPIF